MKRPQPDIGDLIKGRFLKDLGNVRKFKRLWGTTTVSVLVDTGQVDSYDNPIFTTENIQVLRHRQYYYPSSSRSANFEKLFRYLDAYDDVTSTEPKGITSAWIYLNKNKGSDLPYADISEQDSTYNEFVAHNLNQLWWDDNDGPMPEGLTLTTSIVIEALINTTREKKVTTTSLLNPKWTSAQLSSAITSNYNALWDTCLISQQGVGVINKGTFIDEVSKVATPDEDDLSPDDPWLAALARQALRASDVDCTIKDVSIGYGKDQTGKLYPTYVVDIEIPYTLFTASSDVVQKITTDLTTSYSSLTRGRLSYPNGYWTKQEITAMDSSDLQNDPNLVTRPYRLWENEALETKQEFSSIWIKSGNTWYIRADAIDNPKSYGLTYKGLHRYLLSLIDSGYQKKKVPWWKKALAIVLAVIIVVYTGRFDVAAMTWEMFAIIVAAVSLTLTILTLVFSILGMHELASAFAAANKAIEPLAIIATIYLAYLNFAKKAGEKTLKEAAKEYMENFAENFVEDIVKGAADAMAGKVTQLSLSFTSKLLSIVDVMANIRLDQIKDRIRDLQSENEDLQEEMARNSDLLKGFARVYAKPATADWSIYAAEFDYPYEHGGGTLALGNIQKTTKQALRRGIYNDPAFDNILVV